MQIVEIREALRQAIDEEMTRDANVFMLGEEVAEYNGAYKVTKGMLDKWGPERVIDTPIAETGFAGLAIGAAHDRASPDRRVHELEFFICSCRSADLQCLQNLLHVQRHGLKCRLSFEAPMARQPKSPAQHSHCVEAIYGHLPGFIVIAPSNAYDAKGLLKVCHPVQ